MPENFPVVDVPVTVRHRYPWTLEEKGIIAFLLLIPISLFILHLTTGEFDLFFLIGVAAVTLVGAGGLWYLGWSRKNTSELVGTLDGSTLQVVGNQKLTPTNKIDLVTVDQVRAEKVGPNPTFFLSSGDKILRVPLRLAKKQPVKDALLSVFESARLEESAKELARELEKS